MAAETHTAAVFYGTARGMTAARVLRARLADIWPDVRGLSVLGIGYAAPYLPLWRAEARRCIALSPRQGCAPGWPAHSAGVSCMAEEDALPFPDMSFDRIVLVHGLEAADNSRRMLREVWRVLRDDGRVLVVAPNRRGVWAHVESTPFGQGQPYSAGQIGRLLTSAAFRVERRDWALYVPPASLGLVLRGAEMWERGLHRVVPQLGGVTVTEAVKDAYAAIPLPAAARARRRLVLVKQAA